jgi:iron-sulfur cluster assembly protein
MKRVPIESIMVHQVIEVTDKAYERAAVKCNEAESEGIRISLKSGGCAGFEYIFDYCSAAMADDIVVDYGEIKFYIDSTSRPYLEGLTLDFERSGLNEEFKVYNPKEVSKCGCGVSAYF